MNITKYFLTSYNTSREGLSKIEKQLSTQKNINKPSDNPAEVGIVMRLTERINDMEMYKKNIDNAFTQVNSAISALEDMYENAEAVQFALEPLKNNPPLADVESLAPVINNSLEDILQIANTKVGSRYLFGGTNFSEPPVKWDNARHQYIIQTDGINSDEIIRVGSGLDIDMNINGIELFGSLIEQKGNFDINAAVGSSYTNSETMYNADGEEYTFEFTYTKTADHTYDLSYTVLDENNVAFLNDTKELVFSDTTGEMLTVDGDKAGIININDSNHKLNFYFDPSDAVEANKNATLYHRQNQKADIFNVLQSVKEKLEVGEVPTTNQFRIMDGFSDTVLDTSTIAGNMYSRLDDAEKIVNRQDLELKTLYSKRQDVDVPKALMDLENQKYNLDLLYKVSGMLLPKSLADYI
jgi:flagellar hook-associated protein 3 FlgL